MEGTDLLFLLAVKLALFPEALEGATFFTVLKPTIAVDFSIQPLTIVLITVFVDDLSSSVFLAVSELPFVKVSSLHDLNSSSGLGYSSFLVLADSSEVDVSFVMIYYGFCDWHEREDKAIFVLFNRESSVFTEAIIEKTEELFACTDQ